jgi:predicted nucleotidyltransferase
MIAIIEEKRRELAETCRTYHVRRLELFGSATLAKRFDPRNSDLDFLVEFESADEMNPADQYFGLWEALKDLFGRDVDLVTVRSLRNPYFIRSVNATREPVYAS